MPMRSAIARHMMASKQMAPQAWMMMEADVSRWSRCGAHKGPSPPEEGVPLTYVPFFIKAVVDSLKQFPLSTPPGRMSASW